MKKLTQEEVEKRVKEANPFYEIRGEYKNTRTKVLTYCKIHDIEWLGNPDNLFKGLGCPKCVSEKRSKSKLKTNEQFLQDLQKVNPFLEPLESYINKATSIRILCKQCGKIFKTNPNHLLSTKTGCPSCSAKRGGVIKMKTNEEFLKELNDIRPLLIPMEDYKGAHTSIKIKCSIHPDFEWSATPSNLLYGRGGCPQCNKKMHLGEEKIQEYLLKSNIVFEFQKKFSDLKDVNQLSYDFYLPDYNLLIEYNGQQHCFPVNFFGGEKTFKKQVEHDNMKREYAESHNYNLLEIWYYDFNSIEEILNKTLKNQK